MERARRVAVAGHRQEERNSSGGLHQQASRTRRAVTGSDPSGKPRPIETDSNDDILDNRRVDPHGDRDRRGFGSKIGDRGYDYRRPESVFVADFGGDAGGVFDLRRA